MGVLQEFGIQVPKYKVASTPEEVYEIVKSGGKLTKKKKKKNFFFFFSKI
jgi:hypothetical protein